jgi:hypothetical protein
MIINENGQGNAPVVEEAPVKKTKKQLAAEAAAAEEAVLVEENAEQE